MNVETQSLLKKTTGFFSAKVNLKIQTGRFSIQTIATPEELYQAFKLRYQVFQVEMIGHEKTDGIDFDEYDMASDHLAVFDVKTNQMVATCRLNSSLFSNKFYSAREFNCQALLDRPEIKLELGRVCVHKDFRKGVIIMLLWRALAQYMMKTKTQILFGCGSVLTENPQEAVTIYKYLQEQRKVRSEMNIHPTEKYASPEFQYLLSQQTLTLSTEDSLLATKLLPSLCKSYFDIGCYVPGPPAFDHDFKCIDFLTILESHQLESRMRQKLMGNDS